MMKRHFQCRNCESNFDSVKTWKYLVVNICAARLQSLLSSEVPTEALEKLSITDNSESSASTEESDATTVTETR